MNPANTLGKLVAVALLATGLQACATTPRPTVVAPTGVTLTGTDMAQPDPSMPNIVVINGLGLPLTTRDVTVGCADGRTEHVTLRNDGIPAGVLVVNGLFVAAGGVLLYQGATATDPGGGGWNLGLASGAALLTTSALSLATSWQPSQPVTTLGPDKVCGTTTTPSSAPAPEAASPAPAPASGTAGTAG